MKLPSSIQQLAAYGLAQMHAHPQHHFDWRIRRQLYHLFRDEDPHAGFQAHGWLAVIAAEHVLPLFTSIFPHDRLPVRLIHYAKRVLTGSIVSTSWRIAILEDQGYLGTGIDMLDLRNGAIAYDAEYAGSAAYKSIVEARGAHNLLDHVETLRRQNGYVLMGGGTQKPEFDHNEHGSSFTDADIAHLAAFSDTASAAAIAYACERQQFQIHTPRLQDYWEWWLQYALPEAWSRV